MKIFCMTLALFVLCSCMSDKEYQLRAKDIEAKKAHPATYQPLVVTGPLTLQEGATIVATTPSQPYVPTDIPNGAQIQSQTIQSLANTAGLVGLGAMGIYKAGDSTKVYNVANEGGK